MSTTPIFDAVLADAPRNIWQASPVFPQPTVVTDRRLCDAEETYTITGWEDSAGFATPPLQPAFTDWSAIKLGGDA